MQLDHVCFTCHIIYVHFQNFKDLKAIVFKNIVCPQHIL